MTTQGRHFSARMAILDKQLADSDDLPFGRVDDVELSTSPAGAPSISALLVGAEALGQRLGGLSGRVLSQPAARLRARSSDPGPVRVDPALVDHLEPMVKLREPLAALAGAAPLEKWLGQHFIGRLPGAGDAVE